MEQKRTEQKSKMNANGTPPQYNTCNDNGHFQR
jgi:hypothetical protein